MTVVYDLTAPQIIVPEIKKTFDWRSTSVGWRYGIALLAFVISFSIRQAMDVWLFTDRGFILFLPAILLVTFVAGLGPAILTTALSAIALWYVFLPPFYSFELRAAGAVGLTTFAFGSAVGIVLVYWLRILIDRAEAERGRSDSLAASIAADLRGVTRLNELGNLLVREGKDIDKCLGEILEVAIVIGAAKKGNIQLFDLDSNTLYLAAQRGFHDFFLKYFEEVRDVGSACAAAMQSRQQVIVEDVQKSEIFAGRPSLNVMLAEDARAVISTPLTSGAGILLGSRLCAF